MTVCHVLVVFTLQVGTAVAEDGARPGAAATQRLGNTPVDINSPPAYEPETDALGPEMDLGVSQDLRRLGLKPGLPEHEPAGMAAADATGAPVLELSVEQAVLKGLQNNRGLLVEQLNPVITGTFEDIERAVFDPVVFAEFGYDREAVQQSDRATQQTFAVEGFGSDAAVGVRQSLPTGTDIELSLSQNRTDSDRTQRQYGTRAGITVTQALLRGAGIDANLASVRQAEVDTLLSVYELHGFTETLVADIESTYWDYVLAQRRIEIFNKALEVAKQQLDETEQRIRVGQLSETEESSARAEVALRQQDLIDARSELEKTRLQLLQLTNPKTATGWQQRIRATADPQITAVPLDSPDERLALAMRMRPELNQARLDIERGRLQVVETRNGLLPQLDVFLTLGKSSFSNSFNRSFDDFDGPSYDGGVGVNFEFPVRNRAAEARYRSARATRDQAELSLKNLAQLVSLDIRTAFVEVQRTRQQISASTATRELQEQVLETEQVRFRVGESTSFDVALAQRDLIESQIGEVEARVAHRKALIELYRLEGSLLERRGIDLPGSDKINISTAGP
ncbi:outer membrane protein TolC [Methylohalomonas lacus]|uniref:Outer membrane protein TolC n=1 Tax=Methylohalomonas lacus TaxID=398773 RepID=A0AAE3L2C1_9GAMM|nr:TolC family protein [Methylohalomonas lacus]MCS3904271.1 outer membrane protein TolC [Methylohalomonas lacus]